MSPGARTPEELESLFEDCLLAGDGEALDDLFDAEALLLAGPGETGARGREEIPQLVMTMCERGYRYVADPRRVLQARDTTLVVAEHAINVMRRGGDGRWRYAISLLEVETATEGDIA